MAKQEQKQQDFITMALGGPSNYKGKNMREAHKNLHLKEEHFNTIVKHLAASLTELGVPENLIG